MSPDDSIVRRRPWDLRLALAIRAGVSAAALSRYARQGGGSTIGGRVTLGVDPKALPKLGRGRVAACVSGSNGKTTTTRLLATALRTRGDVVSNSSGANMHSGLVTVLMRHRQGPAVLEVDELYLPTTMDAVSPRVVVLLNLTRDQLDRSGEIQRIAAKWRAALQASPGTVVIANCDDPHIAWAAEPGSRVVWVAAGLLWSGDAMVCPQCGHLLEHDSTLTTRSTMADWRCTSCSLRRPTADAHITDEGLVMAGSQTFPVDLRLPGEANRTNAAMAALAAAELGVPVREGLAAMTQVREIEGRYSEQPICGRPMRLLLAKNPAGWAETLEVLQENTRPLLLSVNANPVDGCDTSWLYDVPFEVLAGRQVTVTGVAGADLSLRLEYAGVAHHYIPGLQAAVQSAAQAAAQLDGDTDPGAGATDVIGDYSSFQSLRRLAMKS